MAPEPPRVNCRITPVVDMCRDRPCLTERYRREQLISATVFVLILQALRARRGSDAAIPHPPDRMELKRCIHCPQCHRVMDTHYYAGPGNIVIDDCPSCELNWLDAGELMVIVRAPDRAYDVDSELTRLSLE